MRDITKYSSQFELALLILSLQCNLKPTSTTIYLVRYLCVSCIGTCIKSILIKIFIFYIYFLDVFQACNMQHELKNLISCMEETTLIVVKTLEIDVSVHAIYKGRLGMSSPVHWTTHLIAV